MPAFRARGRRGHPLGLGSSGSSLGVSESSGVVGCRWVSVGGLSASVSSSGRGSFPVGDLLSGMGDAIGRSIPAWSRVGLVKDLVELNPIRRPAAQQQIDPRVGR